MDHFPCFITRFCDLGSSRFAAVPAILLVALVFGSVGFCGEIHDAAAAGNLEKVKAILSKKPAVANSKEHSTGETPLHLAAEEGHKDVVEFLLANKADVNAKDNDGQTPLYMAASSDHETLADFASAVQAAAIAKGVGQERQSPLPVKASPDYVGVVRLLLAKKADVNAANSLGQTPLEHFST